MNTIEYIKLQVSDEETEKILKQIIDNFHNLNKGINAYVWIKFIQMTINGETVTVSDIPELDEDVDDYTFFHEDSDIIRLLHTSDIQEFELMIEYMAVVHGGGSYGLSFFRELFKNNDSSVLSSLEYKAIVQDSVSVQAYKAVNGELINMDQNGRVEIRPEDVSSVFPDIHEWYSYNFNVNVYPDINYEGNEFEEDVLEKLTDLSIKYFKNYAIENEDQCIEDYEELESDEDLGLPTHIYVPAESFPKFCEDVGEFVNIADENDYHMDCGGEFIPSGKHKRFVYIHKAFEKLEYCAF